MATMEERRIERRWRNFWRFTWLIVIVGGFYFSSFHHPGGTNTNATHTAVVQLSGEIMDGTDASAENVVAALRAAFEEPASKGVIIRINSPGGSPVQAGLINDEIKRLKTLHKKPVYAVVEESCASGAYYVAVAADAIFVNKASIVGSIGVLMDGFGFTGLMDKLGVERRLFTAGENKGFLDPFSKQSDKQKAYAQAMLNQIHQQFIEAVKQGRGTRLKDSPDVFSGLFWTGQQAIEMGLADHLGSMDGVARDIIKAEDLIDYTLRENVAERLARKFGAAVGAGAIKAMHEAPGLR